MMAESGMMVRDALVNALAQLDKKTFKRFKKILSGWKNKEGYISITEDQLEGADRIDVADLIRRHYGDSYGAEVTLALLEAIHERKVREDLQQALQMVQDLQRPEAKDLQRPEAKDLQRPEAKDLQRPEAKDLQRPEAGVSDAIGHQYRCRKERFQEPAAGVSDAIGHQYKHWKAIFMDKHSTDLIRRITVIDPVLRDVWKQGQLTQEQYNDLREKPTSLEKMRGLCHISRHWDDDGKFEVYIALRRHNPTIISDISDIETNDCERRNLNRSYYSRQHNIEQLCFYPELSMMKPFLDDLLVQKLLTQELYEYWASKQYMDWRKLSDIAVSWDKIDKDLFYLTVRKHIYRYIRQLERHRGIRVTSTGYPFPNIADHFVDELDLIGRITVIDPVLDDLLEQKLLTQEQYDGLVGKATSLDKMRDLYKIIKDWHQIDKDMVYLSLRRHNYSIIREMERDMTRLYPYKLSFHWPILRNHQSDLIRRIILVDPVLDDLLEQELLTQEQYDDLCNKPTSEDKMRDLYDTVTSWDDQDKEKMSKALRRYNYWVIKDLELEDRYESKILSHSSSAPGGHFVDRHRSDIIRRIILVDPILDDLREKRLLTKEQYDDLIKKITYEDKMRDLCDIVSNWENADKDTFCKTLMIYNNSVIRDMEEEDRNARFKLPYSGRHFVDRHRSALIGRITVIDPVLDDLMEQWLLTQEQCYDFARKATSEDKMRDLYGIVSGWDHSDKDVFYLSLRRHNYTIIRSLERDQNQLHQHELSYYSRHYVDKHKTPLIGRITVIEQVLDDLLEQRLLTQEQYDDFIKKATSKDMIKDLYGIIKDWHQTNKDKFYLSVMTHKYTFIRDLECDQNQLHRHKLSYYTGENYLWKYRTDLIRKIILVDPVLDDLMDQKQLTQEQYKRLCDQATSEDKMRNLCDIVCSWCDDDKEKVVMALRRHNSWVTEDLELEDQNEIMKFKPFTIDEKSWDKLWDFPIIDIEDPLDEKFEKLSFAPTACAQTERRHMECRLCGKAQHSNDVVIPVLKGSKYRLELTCAGLFRCQKTGIQFQVKHPVTIKYNLESWDDHMKGIQGDRYEIVSPLFNIRTGDPQAVSAVYLPHYLCIAGFIGNKSQIKCAHFKDQNMTLEPPTRIEPFYIVLENPSFSFLGALLSFMNIKVPIHGSVLIYFRVVCKDEPEYQEYKINLYLVPHSAHTEENLDKKNMKFGFQRILKPPQASNPVYTKIKYLVRGRPGADVRPATLQFHSHHLSDPYQYTEISIKGTDIDIYIDVSEEESEDKVWDTKLTKGEIRDITGPTTQPANRESTVGAFSPPEHFVDTHRCALIERMSHIDPVLDNLLSQRLLTQEQYDCVRKKKPHQEKMRQLYGYISMWGHTDKEKLYQALKKNNKSLIRDLNSH